MINKEIIKSIADNSKIIEELNKKLAILELKNKALDFKNEANSSKNNFDYSKEKDMDKKYFLQLKKQDFTKNETEKFLIKKAAISFKVIYDKLWQKQITVSDYNHADTSYIKYEVYVQINYGMIRNYKYLLKSYVDENSAREYFNTLKEKIEKSDANTLLEEILNNVDEKVLFLKKQLKT